MGFRFSPGCCCEFCKPGNVNCPACACNVAPNAYKVVLAGIVNNGCSDCGNLNGTYFLCEIHQDPSDCDWELLLDPPVCGFTAIRMAVIASFPAGVFVGLHRGPDHADWREPEFVGQIELCGAVDLNVPFAPLFTTSGASAQCDFSGSTCTVTRWNGGAKCRDCRCNVGTFPAQYQVVTAGFSCANYNDTFVLSPTSTPTVGGCTYDVAVDPTRNCPAHSLTNLSRVTLRVLDNGYDVRFTASGSNSGWWKKTGYSLPRNCSESGLVLDERVNGPLGTTATITAL